MGCVVPPLNVVAMAAVVTGTRLLAMRETLEANGIPDESVQFDVLSMDEDAFIPTIHLYFSDDLTVA